jgi:hypothetical protein
MKRFLSIVLMALFVNGPALCQPHTNTDANNASQPEAVDSKPDLKPSPIAGEDAKGGSGHKKEQCDYKGPKWFAGFYCFFADHEKFWVSFGTLVLAAFTTILGFATVILARATNKLVRGADANAERQLRAYVLAVQGRVRRFAINEPVEIGITTKNTGQTPGYDCHQTISIAMRDYPPSGPFEDIIWSHPTYKSTIGPGEFSSSFASFPDFKISQNQPNKIVAGKAAIWAYGEIRYRDAFGKAHVTKFKFIYIGDTETDPPGGMSCDADGNEAD